MSMTPAPVGSLDRGREARFIEGSRHRVNVPGKSGDGRCGPRAFDLFFSLVFDMMHKCFKVMLPCLLALLPAGCGDGSEEDAAPKAEDLRHMAVEARKAGYHEEADRQLKQAAELGDARAMYEWGCILLDGSAATQQNVTEAVAWLNKASAA